MTAPKISDADFIRFYQEEGPSALARRLEQLPNGVYRRRRNLEEKYSIRLNGPEDNPKAHPIKEHPARLELALAGGVVLIGSDAHYWPGDPPLMHRAFIHFANLLKPKIIVMNGDAFDGASISCHPPIGWTHHPTVQQEIETCQDRLHEIAAAAPRGCKKIWSLGNHDSRFETRIATVAPELAKVNGTSLHDHFPVWQPCWSTWINNEVVIKHRFKGGIHATHNNAIWAGKTMITGHLHSAKVTPFTDYNGTRYGVDTGCIADTYSQAFDYAEDNPRNWRSGFAVLTFKDEGLLMPELVTAWDRDRVQFRGEVIRV